jgi:hypothetical protein
MRGCISIRLTTVEDRVSLIRLAFPAATLVAFVACSAPPQTAAPSAQPTTASAPRPAGGSPGPAALPAGSPAPVGPAGAADDAEAIQEIQTVRAGYVRAQEALQAGRRDEALDLLNTTYLDHFDRIEPYLDRRFSQDYRLEVEAAISANIRRRLRDGAPSAEVLAQFPAGFAKLDEVEQRLGAP